jgi:TolB protein
MKRRICFLLAAALSFAHAETVVTVSGAGAAKHSVSIEVEGAKAFADCLGRNLDLSGCFRLVAKGGSIRVTGRLGGDITVSGPASRLTLPLAAPEAPRQRAEARRLSDRMCEVFAGAKGFAQDRIAFVSRTGPRTAELCTCYPDGNDIVQLTQDGKSIVGPRWKDASTLFYTGLFNAGPQVFEHAVDAGRRQLKWSFRGLTTGATVSPDGRSVAIILSIHGNPDLYVIDMASGRWRRLTDTKNASEGVPSWSPDGKKIVYVSDETRSPQLYVIDVETRQKRRLTKKGSQNTDPDWGADGRIAYVTKRNGQNAIAVIPPADGDAAAELVTPPGTWEHPSWSRDGRHLVATRDKALFVVDTVPAESGGDKPRIVFKNAGTWITPSWSTK